MEKTVSANDNFAPVDYDAEKDPNRTEFRWCTWKQKHHHCIIFMEFEMRQFVYDSWNSVMNAEKNPSETYSRFTDQTYGFTNSCMDVGNNICIMDGKYLCVWYF